MHPHRVFPNPTVKMVIFQIRFPNLFYLENKIGEFQLKVMQEFPESKLSHRRSIVLADLAPGTSSENVEGEPWIKIWEFSSPKKVVMNVLINSLDLSSKYHTSYDVGGDNFKDTIMYAVDKFLSIANVPIFTRIGLRYIDECPIPEKLDNKSFREYYNSAFPLNRFELSDAEEMGTVALVRKSEYFMRYSERLHKVNNELKLNLDFDAFANNVPSNNYVAITDALHEIVSSEFHSMIKVPVYEYMEKERE